MGEPAGKRHRPIRAPTLNPGKSQGRPIDFHGLEAHRRKRPTRLRSPMKGPYPGSPDRRPGAGQTLRAAFSCRDFRGCLTMGPRPLEGDELSGVCPTTLCFDRPGGAASAAGLNDARDGARRDPEHRRQAIDRDHQHVVLTPLHSTNSNKAQNCQSAAAAPPSPAAGRPHGLLGHAGEVQTFVGPGLRLNDNADTGGGDRDRIDVAPTFPGQRVSQPLG